MNWVFYKDTHILNYDSYMIGVKESSVGAVWEVRKVNEVGVVCSGVASSLEEAKEKIEGWLTQGEENIWEKKLLWELWEEGECVKGEAYLKDIRIRLVWSEEASAVVIGGMFLNFKKIPLDILQSVAFAFAATTILLEGVVIETQKSAFVFSHSKGDILTVVTVGEKEIVTEKSDGAKVSREVEDIGSVGRLDLREIVERVIPIFKESE